MNELKDTSLFRENGLIGGEWRGAAAGRKIEVVDPATQGVLGTVPDAPADLSGGKSNGQILPWLRLAPASAIAASVSPRAKPALRQRASHLSADVS